MNTEEDEFKRIEAEALRLWAAQTDDDDTQVYKKPWVGLTDVEATALWEAVHNEDSWELIKRVEAKLKKKNA